MGKGEARMLWFVAAARTGAATRRRGAGRERARRDGVV
jgi:hypothetical protein